MTLLIIIGLIAALILSSVGYLKENGPAPEEQLIVITHEDCLYNSFLDHRSCPLALAINKIFNSCDASAGTKTFFADGKNFKLDNPFTLDEYTRLRENPEAEPFVSGFKPHHEEYSY